MLDSKTQELAGIIYAHFLGGWAASGRPMPALTSTAEAEMAIGYAKLMMQALKSDPDLGERLRRAREKDSKS